MHCSACEDRQPGELYRVPGSGNPPSGRDEHLIQNVRCPGCGHVWPISILDKSGPCGFCRTFLR